MVPWNGNNLFAALSCLTGSVRGMWSSECGERNIKNHSPNQTCVRVRLTFTATVEMVATAGPHIYQHKLISELYYFTIVM